ncbi:MAG: helix-turn-helix transcriptional regulator [Actinomycetota bacterium]
MATNTKLGRQVAPEESSPADVLRIVMRVLDVTGAELAAALGVSKQTVHFRMKGERSMSADDLKDTAAALDIDPRLFMGSEFEAMQWLVKQRPHLFSGGEVTGA